MKFNRKRKGRKEKIYITYDYCNGEWLILVTTVQRTWNNLTVTFGVVFYLLNQVA